MWSLIARGKLAISEDVLTAIVFDELALAKERMMAQRLLALGLNRDRQALLVTDPCTPAHIELWPRTAAGEPDVRLSFTSATGLHIVLVEAKLGAGKSGHGELDADQGSGDQLGRYLREERRREPEARVSLLYLTHHAAFPREDIEDSMKSLHREADAALRHEIFWASWRDVEDLLAERPEFVMSRDALRQVSMFRFKGRWPCGGERTSTWAYGQVEATRRHWSWLSPVVPSAAWTYRSRPATSLWPCLDRWLGTALFYRR
jgi:hypothetical protein